MIDTIQNNFESIHTMSESWMNRFKQKRYDTSLNRFTIQVIRFIQRQRVLLLFQGLSESIQTSVDTIHQRQRAELTYLGHKGMQVLRRAIQDTRIKSSRLTRVLCTI